MTSRSRPSASEPMLLPNHGAASRRRRSLILPRLLADEAGKEQYAGADQDRAQRIILKWADLELRGRLQNAKETSLDAEFLNQVFGEGLGYSIKTHDVETWNLEREFTVHGVGEADGALGTFAADGAVAPIAVIELKDANADLDRSKFNGRTPVQQCWDYLNALPACPWGIVSNLISIRLYHRNHTPLAYEEFTLQEMRDHKRFRQFFCLFHHDGLLKSRFRQPPRTMRLLQLTGERQREVGDDLYRRYSTNRLHLIAHLHQKHGKALDRAIAIAQKLLDRIVFIAFCEDRALLPPKIIEKTHRDVPMFDKARNPRWRNFVNLFHAVDAGHETLKLERGFNGGLFRRDPEVDDLQLDDDWTDFFREVGTYDFRDEVNVDVLGHLFEKSITEIEKLRQGGLFNGGEAETVSRMPKSAKRKRFGIYYTPPEFTGFLVRSTVDAVIDERLNALARQFDVDPNADATGQDAGRLADYWRACLAAMREVKVCDPACGSGAFLIQAYEVFEERYHTICKGLAAFEHAAADRLEDDIPDLILSDNLFGVDLSPEAVEISQLALWIRSARPGRTLADLSNNIVVGNSLVSDAAVDPAALNWREAFPQVFSRERPGFDCVFGNPPWERLKLQEREFFAFIAPEIAEAVSAATRRRLIAALERSNPDLYQRYLRAKQRAEAVLSHARTGGAYPLTGKGDINTYVLFAELARTLVAAKGRVGLLVPSGIATDNTTRDFFSELVDSKALIQLYDFENKAPIFPDVHRSFKFSALVFGGREVETPSVDFVFFARTMDDLHDRKRHITLTAEDIALLNPNTRTCPIFRSNRDAEITKGIYRRVPVLVEASRGDRGNRWGIRFLRMFDQTNDAELFHTAEQLDRKGFKRRGNRWTKGKQAFLPLYEAKMVQAYDHRAASVVIDKENWMRQGQTQPTSLVSHQQPEFVPEPRWWVAAAVVEAALGESARTAYLCFKDVTSPTNERTMIAAFLPQAGVLNSAPLILTGQGISPRRACCLLANLNSFVLDFVARQKVGNVHLNFFIVKQFPMLPPDAYEQKCPWHGRQTLERWISDRVLKLTCTADDLRPLAEACGMKTPVHKWRPEERTQLLAELDAAYFLLYGVARDDAEYILSTFTGTRRRDQSATGGYRTAELILAAYDTLRQKRP